jgi:hypothetical protein
MNDTNAKISVQDQIEQILKDWVAEAHYDEVVGYRRELDAGVYTLVIYTYDEYRMRGLDGKLFRKYADILQNRGYTDLITIVSIDGIINR